MDGSFNTTWDNVLGETKPEPIIEKKVINNTAKFYSTFEDMKYTKDNKTICIKDDILQGIYAYGWDKPSGIQSKSIVPLMEGRDIIAQAQSGTGKTGSFSIGVLSRIDEKCDNIQGIIILNTHELASQVYSVLTGLAEYMNVKVVKCIGGTPVNDDRIAINKKPHIVIGTPGRIADLLNKKILDLSKLKIFIMDESDELLGKGFYNNICEILSHVPPQDCNIGIFSATIPKQIEEIGDKFLQNPVKILVNKEHLPLEGIKQFYFETRDEYWKFEMLCKLYERIGKSQVMIFVNSTNKCDILSNKLRERGHTVANINGKMNEEQRNKIMEEFKQGKTRILITTDLLARGIDIYAVSLVINYEIPTRNNFENYIHRIGRAGRFGRKGCAINFIKEDEKELLNDLINYYKINMTPLTQNFDTYML